MGTGTLINRGRQQPAARTPLSLPNLGDLPLLMTVTVLAVLGLVMVYSASWDFSLAVYDSPTYMFNRQVVWMGLGLLAMVVLSRFDYHYWRRLVVPVMLVTIAALIGVLLTNDNRLGAVRSYFEGSVQPSELAKLVTIIYLAAWLYAKQEHLYDVNLGLIPLGTILGIVGGLIFLQPDLSATATVLILGGLLFFLAGGDIRQITFLLILTVIVGYVVIQFSPTGLQRIREFWLGIVDPTQASYHVRRSLEAIVKGNFFGVGLGQANTKYTGLPVPPTDSIFAVIAEELGFFGSLVTLSLYGLLIWRGLKIAAKAPDFLGTILAAGLTIWIGLEAVVNISVMVGLLPFAGNALPFISAGGSNLTASLAAVGILFNIARQGSNRKKSSQNPDERREFGATVGLRRGNRRRSVSRVGRA
ncbi:MAG: putative peptidoglycan glycosyltransferase FtsW [Chloroflexota bacterium]